MNAKGTTNAVYQIGKRGGKIFGGVTTPNASDISTGDIWLDKSNTATKIAIVTGDSVAWNDILTSGSTADTLPEGSTNLYYTTARANAAIDAKLATDVVIGGNLTISGTTTTINTETLNIEDNILVLNSGFTGADNTVDAGFEVNRGSETNVTLLWDESEGEWTYGSETVRAGSFIGELSGDVVGSIRPNGVQNNVTVSGNLVTTGANVIGLSTSSVSEGSNQYYTDTRARASISATGTGLTYNNSTGVISYSMPNLTVNDFALTAYNATNDVWDDDDSTFATTGRITDMINTEIANASTVVHTTGNETITGSKTISGATLTLTANSTLDVSNATVPGANSDSISEGSTNLYYSNPRARTAISVTDNSTAGNELTYNSSTGVLSWEGTAAGSPGGANTQIQFNDSGSFGGHANLTYDSASETLAVSKLNVANFTYQILSEDYGSTTETTLVTKDFGNLSVVAQGEYMHDLTDDDSPQLSANLDLNTNNITGTGDIINTGNINTQIVTATSYKDTVFTITDGASVDIDPDNGGIQVWTLGANRSPTATNFDTGAKVMLMIADGTNYSITWPSVNWVGGVAPTLPTSGYGIVELWKVGTQLYGAFAGGVA